MRRDVRVNFDMICGRTAARNMINLGVPERVTMAVLGHKTTSMLHRYFIVSPSDLQDVARRLADKAQSKGTG